MWVRWSQTGLVLALLPGWIGCLGPRRADYVSSTAIAVTERSPSVAEGREGDRLWEAVQDTLRRHGFRLDRVDRRAGLVTTMPEASQHFFEFWRRDVATREDFWEATLNPIRRRAEVTVTPGANGAWAQLEVAVFKQRFSSPDRQFNSTGAVYQYFGDTLPSTTGNPRISAVDDRWLDLGRDGAMEERLLLAIVERAGVEVGRPAGEAG